MLRASVHRGSSRLTAAALARPAPAVGGVRRLTDREPRPGPPATRPGACGGARTAELSPSAHHTCYCAENLKKTRQPKRGVEENPREGPT